MTGEQGSSCLDRRGREGESEGCIEDFFGENPRRLSPIEDREFSPISEIGDIITKVSIHITDLELRDSARHCGARCDRELHPSELSLIVGEESEGSLLVYAEYIRISISCEVTE